MILSKNYQMSKFYEANYDLQRDTYWLSINNTLSKFVFTVEAEEFGTFVKWSDSF